jgi:tRNA-dihydrouridine synthase B
VDWARPYDIRSRAGLAGRIGDPRTGGPERGVRRLYTGGDAEVNDAAATRRYTAAVPQPPPFPPGSLFLAPMVGLSHRALRELVLGFGGLDYAYTEMASAAALVSGSPYDEWYLDADPAPERVVCQLYATKSERLPEALAALKEKEGSPLFGADINFGCSAPHITKAGGGAAWMRDPRRAFALVRSARAAWDRRLSAKIRLGADDDYGRLADFVRGIAEAGIDFVAVHPRLEAQKFRRLGRWDYVARLASEMPIPVIGNGDIRTWDDYRQRASDYSPAGVMIGREAARRPWIFALLRGREADEDFSIEVDLRATAHRMLELVESRLPPDFRLTRARRFFYYFADNFSFAHHIRWRLQNAPSLDAMRKAIDEYLLEAPGDAVRAYQG